MPQSLHGVPGATRYARIANHLADLIRRGAYGPGERIPSVRKLSRELGVGVNTVLEAYAQLEARGFIAAAPQRGYFVRADLPAIPRTVSDGVEPGPGGIDRGSLTARVMADVKRLPFGALGAAVPDPEVVPSAALARLMRRATSGDPAFAAHYEVHLGNERLRRMVARRALYGGATVAPEEVLITNGATEALAIALRITCPPGAAVAVESPGYFNNLLLVRHLGLRPVEIPTDCAAGMDLSALRRALTEEDVAAVLCVSAYQNPTGACAEEERRHELVALCAAQGVPIIEDDIYGELHFGDKRPPLLRSLADDGEVLVCSSVSKTIAPGLRVGWLLPGGRIEEALNAKALTTLGSPDLVQEVVAAFADTGDFDRHLRRIRPLYEQHIAALTAAVRRHLPAGTRITEPAGGFVLWLELPAEIDVIKLYDAATAAGISFAPGPVFGSTGDFSHHLRLNAACWRDDFDGAIATLGRFVDRLG